MWFDIIKNNSDEIKIFRDLGYDIPDGMDIKAERKKHISMMENLLQKLKQEIPYLDWDARGFFEDEPEHLPDRTDLRASGLITGELKFNSDDRWPFLIFGKFMDSGFELVHTPTPVHHRDLTAEEVITKIKEYVSDPRERAEQLVIETANELDYVTIKGDEVIIRPDWINQYLWGDEFESRPDREMYFNLNNIHEKLCIRHRIVGEKTIQGEYCLSQDRGFDAPVADSYVTAMLMASTKENWMKIWEE